MRWVQLPSAPRVASGIGGTRASRPFCVWHFGCTAKLASELAQSCINCEIVNCGHSHLGPGGRAGVVVVGV